MTVNQRPLSWTLSLQKTVLFCPHYELHDRACHYCHVKGFSGAASCKQERTLLLGLCVCVRVSHSVVSDSLRPTRLLCPRNFLGKDTGVGCHFLLHLFGLVGGKSNYTPIKFLTEFKNKKTIGRQFCSKKVLDVICPYQKVAKATEVECHLPRHFKIDGVFLSCGSWIGHKVPEAHETPCKDAAVLAFF